MPATAIDFSYEKDIAPYASRFFGEVSANPNLSSAARTRLQGGILDGAAALQDREFKVREELDQQRSRRLAYETGVTALEEARARRSRAEQAEAQLGGVHALASDILASRDAPEVKRQRLAEARFQNSPALALNPDADQIFQMADRSIPEGKDRITAAQMLPLILQGIPREMLDHANETGDFSHITGLGQKIEDAEYVRRERLKDLAGKDDDAEALRLKYLSKPLKFMQAADETTGKPADSPYLEPESTEQGQILVDHFGSTEEKKRFDALKSFKESDTERAMIVMKIQNRELLARMGGASGGGKPDAAAIARARIGLK